MVLYAGVVVLLSVERVLFWWYVYYRARLVRPGTDPRLGRFEFYRGLAAAAVFGVSILIAFWSPLWAMYSWIILLPLAVAISFRASGSY